MEQRTLGDDLRRLAFNALVALLCSWMMLDAGEPVIGALAPWAIPVGVAVALVREWRSDGKECL